MINDFYSNLKKQQQWSPLFLRLIIGFGFMAHGWAKLSTGAPVGFEKLLTYLNTPLPHITAWVTVMVELVGGLAIFSGFYVGITAIPLIITMLVAMFSVHIHYGFSTIKTIGLTPSGPLFGSPGYEINLLYIAGLVSIMITGAGIYSIDDVIGEKKK